MTSDLLYEPGVWVLSALLVVAGINLVAAWLLRSTRRRVLALITDMAHDPSITLADKAALRVEIRKSKGSHLLVAAPFAPFAIIGAIAVGLSQGWGERRFPFSQTDMERLSEIKRLDAQIKKLDEGIERLDAEIVFDSEGYDPRLGVFWGDPRMKEVRGLMEVIENWNNPVAMLWIATWLLLTLPFVGLGYLVSGSMRPFLMNLWQPLREPVTVLLPRRSGGASR